jgi:hypothetical protein
MYVCTVHNAMHCVFCQRANLRCFTVWSPDGMILSHYKDSCARFYYIVAVMTGLLSRLLDIFSTIKYARGAQLFQKSRRHKNDMKEIHTSKYVGHHCAEFVHRWRSMCWWPNAVAF